MGTPESASKVRVFRRQGTLPPEDPSRNAPLPGPAPPFPPSHARGRGDGLLRSRTGIRANDHRRRFGESGLLDQLDGPPSVQIKHFTTMHPASPGWPTPPDTPGEGRPRISEISTLHRPSAHATPRRLRTSDNLTTAHFAPSNRSDTTDTPELKQPRPPTRRDQPTRPTTARIVRDTAQAGRLRRQHADLHPNRHHATRHTGRRTPVATAPVRSACCTGPPTHTPTPSTQNTSAQHRHPPHPTGPTPPDTSQPKQPRHQRAEISPPPASSGTSRRPDGFAASAPPFHPAGPTPPDAAASVGEPLPQLDEISLLRRPAAHTAGAPSAPIRRRHRNALCPARLVQRRQSRQWMWGNHCRRPEEISPLHRPIRPHRDLIVCAVQPRPTTHRCPADWSDSAGHAGGGSARRRFGGIGLLRRPGIPHSRPHRRRSDDLRTTHRHLIRLARHHLLTGGGSPPAVASVRSAHGTGPRLHPSDDPVRLAALSPGCSSTAQPTRSGSSPPRR